MTKRILAAAFAGMLLLAACSSNDGKTDGLSDGAAQNDPGASVAPGGSDNAGGDAGGDASEATGRLAEVKVQLTDAGIDCSGEPTQPPSDPNSPIEGPIEVLNCGVVDNTKLEVRQWASAAATDKGIKANMSTRCSMNLERAAALRYVRDDTIIYTTNSPKADADNALLQRIADSIGGELVDAC